MVVFTLQEVTFYNSVCLLCTLTLLYKILKYVYCDVCLVLLYYIYIPNLCILYVGFPLPLNTHSSFHIHILVSIILLFVYYRDVSKTSSQEHPFHPSIIVERFYILCEHIQIYLRT